MDTVSSGRPAEEGTFLADDSLLADVLRDVIRHSEGQGALDLVQRAIALSRASRAGEAAAPGELADLISGLRRSSHPVRAVRSSPDI